MERHSTPNSPSFDSSLTQQVHRRNTEISSALSYLYPFYNSKDRPQGKKKNENRSLRY